MKIWNETTRLPIVIALTILAVNIPLGIFTGYAFFYCFGISLFTLMVSIVFLVNYISQNKKAKRKFLKYLPYILGVLLVVPFLLFYTGIVSK